MAGCRNISIIEMTKWLASSSQISERMSIEEQLELHGIQAHLESVCTGIRDEGIMLRHADGTEEFLKAKTVIVSAGTASESSIRDQFEDTAFDVIPIGDCAHVGTIRTAIESGWDAAARI